MAKALLILIPLLFAFGGTSVANKVSKNRLNVPNTTSTTHHSSSCKAHF